jgi:hypothetical protein
METKGRVGGSFDTSELEEREKKKELAYSRRKEKKENSST